MRFSSALTILIGLLPFLAPAALPASAQGAGAGQPLTGRVETFAGGAEPVLPAELLGLIRRPDTYTAGAARTGELPGGLTGQWYGRVTMTQMAVYPELHPEPYCQEFIRQIEHFFRQGEKGQVTIRFANQPDGGPAVESSDVWFPHGVKVQLTAGEGPALVPGGTNMARTVRDDVKELGANRIEQTRIDLVTIADRERRAVLHSGFTEISALYKITGPRRMQVKILDVDYDKQGKPLWKALMEGELRRW